MWKHTYNSTYVNILLMKVTYHLRGTYKVEHIIITFIHKADPTIPNRKKYYWSGTLKTMGLLSLNLQKYQTDPANFCNFNYALYFLLGRLQQHYKVSIISLKFSLFRSCIMSTASSSDPYQSILHFCSIIILMSLHQPSDNLHTSILVHLYSSESILIQLE